jgi:hypothetical protein
MIIENSLLKKPGIEVEPDYDNMLKKCRIRITDVIPIPPVCVEIISNTGEVYTFGTLGNFSALIGKAKAGKSFTLSLLLACSLISGTTFQAVFRANFPDSKKVILYIDTEQSKHHVHRALKRICTLSSVSEPDNLIVHALRSNNPLERLGAIEFAILNTPNLGMVVIDGIRDLVTSINDEEQATMLTSKLLKWTEERNIHIVTVLHQNKNDQNARGHLGTELINKAETVISVSVDSGNKDIRLIAPEQCRDKEFGQLAFSIDENGLPQIIEDWIPGKSEPERRKKTPPYEIPPETHKVVLKDVFSIQANMIRSELKRATVANVSRHLGYDIGANKADDWITHWMQFKHIITTGTPGTKACKYSINSTGTINPTELT